MCSEQVQALPADSTQYVLSYLVYRTKDSVGVKCSDRAMERGTVTALERERAHRPAGLYLLVTAQEIRVLHRGSA